MELHVIMSSKWYKNSELRKFFLIRTSFKKKLKRIDSKYVYTYCVPNVT